MKVKTYKIEFPAQDFNQKNIERALNEIKEMIGSEWINSSSHEEVGSDVVVTFKFQKA